MAREGDSDSCGVPKSIPNDILSPWLCWRERQVSRNAFYRTKKLAKHTQVHRRTIGKWSELVGIGRKIEEFPLNSDAARRAARRGAQHPRQCSRAIILCCLHIFVFKKVSRANILFAMMNNPQTLLIQCHPHHRRNRSENDRKAPNL